jgi:F420-non-reducing hydrogenase large subunit
MASGKAVDAVFGVDPPPTAKKLRELFYMAHFVHSHTAHFYALAAPDFVVGPYSPPSKRNILGVIEKVGKEIGTEVIKQRRIAQEIQSLLGGHQTFVVMNIPGGVRKGLSDHERDDIVTKANGFIGFAKFTLRIFEDIVLGNNEYVDIILNGPYSLKLHSMGLVDANNKVNFYDGMIRVIDPTGQGFLKFEPKEYASQIGEHVEEWSYAKFPYLKKVGWKGLTVGTDSGVYRVGPLGRLNAANGMATPLAQAEYVMMYKTLGGKPVHGTLAFHWARLIELLYATERALELVKDPEITGTNIRAKLGEPTEGVGVVEAARGTLYHHYTLDKDALIKDVNMIVATTNNYPAICMSVRDAAKGLIHGGKVDQGILNKVEMAFRAYDPCFGCATHFAVGQMPLTVRVFDHNKKLVATVQR